MSAANDTLGSDSNSAGSCTRSQPRGRGCRAVSATSPRSISSSSRRPVSASSSHTPSTSPMPRLKIALEESDRARSSLGLAVATSAARPSRRRTRVPTARGTPRARCRTRGSGPGCRTRSADSTGGSPTSAIVCRHVAACVPAAAKRSAVRSRPLARNSVARRSVTACSIASQMSSGTVHGVSAREGGDARRGREQAVLIAHLDAAAESDDAPAVLTDWDPCRPVRECA